MGTVGTHVVFQGVELEREKRTKGSGQGLEEVFVVKFGSKELI